MRIETGMISIGYIYAVGEAHFAGMEEYVVEGLTCVRSDGWLVKFEDKTLFVMP